MRLQKKLESAEIAWVTPLLGYEFDKVTKLGSNFYDALFSKIANHFYFGDRSEEFEIMAVKDFEWSFKAKDFSIIKTAIISERASLMKLLLRDVGITPTWEPLRWNSFDSPTGILMLSQIHSFDAVKFLSTWSFGNDTIITNVYADICHFLGLSKLYFYPALFKLNYSDEILTTDQINKARNDHQSLKKGDENWWNEIDVSLDKNFRTIHAFQRSLLASRLFLAVLEWFTPIRSTRIGLTPAALDLEDIFVKYSTDRKIPKSELPEIFNIIMKSGEHTTGHSFRTFNKTEARVRMTNRHLISPDENKIAIEGLSNSPFNFNLKKIKKDDYKK